MQVKKVWRNIIIAASRNFNQPSNSLNGKTIINSFNYNRENEKTVEIWVNATKTEVKNVDTPYSACTRAEAAKIIHNIFFK